ncbi:MAG TPA: MFS transporter [Thermomicrobiaceae bacterium]|nr:MFS transporter [Thermomicrobiaceae bacterium]
MGVAHATTDTGPGTSATTRNRLPLLALLAANTVSEIGSSLTLIALPWFVLATTGSAAQTGLTGFSVALPGFLVGIFGGTLVDRLGYRRSSVIADVVSGVGVGLVPTLFRTVGLPFPLLLGLVFLGSMLAIPGLTARRSMLPELAGLAGVRLERTNAAFESIQQLAFLLGPPLAGLLIVWLGPTTVLWIDAASFAFSAVVVGLVVPAFRAAHESASPEGYLTQLRAGLHFLLHEPLLRAMAIALGLFNGLQGPAFAVVLPVYARTVLGGPEALGFLASAVGAGALAGAASYGVVGHRLSRRTIWYVSYLLSPFAYWVLAGRLPLPVLLATYALFGLVMGPVNPMMVTIRHERIPAEMRGRVFATYSAISQLAQPLGILVVGFAIAGVGLRPTVIVLGGTILAAALGMFAVPALRHMDDPPEPARPAS